ncbi:hypothetical protein MGH68_11480 [Erysipelothrix sp. D19-032]
MYTGKSATSINNRFQKFIGMTFNEYLTKFRIQQALGPHQNTVVSYV